MLLALRSSLVVVLGCICALEHLYGSSIDCVDSGGGIEDLHHCRDYAKCSYSEKLDHFQTRVSYSSPYFVSQLTKSCEDFVVSHLVAQIHGLVCSTEAVSKHVIAVSTNLKVCCHFSKLCFLLI